MKDENLENETGKVSGMDKKSIQCIVDSYHQNEKSLVNQLNFKAKHSTTIGNFREDIWKQIFEQIVPKKFVIEQSVFIIDSNGRISSEVDLAIFDETYTPYIFHYGNLKFLPIEAVAVVVECKSKSPSYADLQPWVEKIRSLETCQKSYARMYNDIAVGKDLTKDDKPPRNPWTQTATRPLRILCHLGNRIENKLIDNDSQKGKMFDCIIWAAENNGLIIEWDETKKDLKDWYISLNHAQRKENINNGAILEDVQLNSYQVQRTLKKDGGEFEDVSLLTLNFQLNQLLMLINNPILFPHAAYAKLFNDIGRGVV